MPIPAKRFKIPKGATVATAGSCFAQSLARHLSRMSDVSFLQVEPIGADQPLFSALYGNIYTVRHLLQLFGSAQGEFLPAESAWLRADGRYVDPFRPYVLKEGFATPGDVAIARQRHLAAVRRIFAECSVFVFTLGLTEAWFSATDGAVFPVAPGVVTDAIDPARYRFCNFTYAEILEDLSIFLQKLSRLNPAAACILTVSPVPLTATYTDEHVLTATVHSKSILRAVCSEIESRCSSAFYFPSFEIVSAHFNRGAYFEENLRTVTKEGVEHVMEVFRKAYFGETEAVQDLPTNPPGEPDNSSGGDDVCDDEEIVRSFGF